MGVFRRPELEKDNPVAPQMYVGPRRRLALARTASKAQAPAPEELTEMRERARAEGRTRLYDGRWRDRDPSDAPAGVKPTIRLKAPLTGETVVEDQVQGLTYHTTISSIAVFGGVPMDIQERALKENLDPVGSTPEELAAQLKADIEMWTRLVKAANIKAEQ